MKQASHKRTNSVWFYLYDVPRVVKLIETEKNVGWQQLRGGVSGELLSTEFLPQSFSLGWWKVLEMNSGNSVNILYATELHTLKWLKWSVLCILYHSKKIIYGNAFISCICSQISFGEAEEILGSPIAKIRKVRLRGIHQLALDVPRIPWGSCHNAEVRFSGSAWGPRLGISKLSQVMLGVNRPQPWVRTRKQQDWDSEPDSLDSWSRILLTLSGSPSEITPPSQGAKEERAHWEPDRFSSSPWTD